nr:MULTISPECIES: HNH endonuclease [Corynebacterium]
MTQEVHHVVPLSRGGSHDFTNLMALCKPCHSRISALDGDRGTYRYR